MSRPGPKKMFCSVARGFCNLSIMQRTLPLHWRAYPQSCESSRLRIPARPQTARQHPTPPCPFIAACTNNIKVVGRFQCGIVALCALVWQNAPFSRFSDLSLTCLCILSSRFPFKQETSVFRAARCSHYVGRFSAGSCLGYG